VVDTVVTIMLEITGAGAVPVVVKVVFADVDEAFPAFADTTSKS
jgi:hypothetical protein